MVWNSLLGPGRAATERPATDFLFFLGGDGEFFLSFLGGEYQRINTKSYVINRVLTTRFGRTLTLLLCSNFF